MNSSVAESEPDPATTLQNPELFFISTRKNGINLHYLLVI